MTIDKKWTQIYLIISLNKTSYLKYVMLNKIFIKFPLIWHMVGLCRPYNGIRLVGLDKAVHFFTEPLPPHFNTRLWGCTHFWEMDGQNVCCSANSVHPFLKNVWGLSYIWRCLFAADNWRCDIWRLEIWRLRQLAPKTFGGWDNSRLRHFPSDIWCFRQLAPGFLAPGTFPGQDIWRLGFWCLGRLAPGKFRAQDIWRLDFWC